MPYAKQYDVAEVKGMLMIIEGSRNVTTGNPNAAHSSSLHASQTQDALGGRALTGPQRCSTYKDFDTMVLATTEALNHANGQAALALLDGGANEATFNAPLAGNTYYGSRATRVGKKNTGTITDEPFMIASQAFVKVCVYIAGRLWIQTSYPSQLNARPAPSLADLP